MTPTKFLPMKTPLGSEILENWNLEEPPRHPLSISILQQQLQDKHIGMIIDLSNHDSLYGADLRETGIQYERVPVSSLTELQVFFRKQQNFWHCRIMLFCLSWPFKKTSFTVLPISLQKCPPCCVTADRATSSSAGKASRQWSENCTVQLVAKIFPAQQAVNKVVEKAERFWGDYPNLYIGIHCAYGKLLLVYFLKLMIA